MKKIGFGLVAFLLLGSFLYVYDARVFEAHVVEIGGEYTTDLSLKSLLTHQSLPAGANPEQIQSLKPTIKGWLLLLAIFLALPVMIAFRLDLPSKSSPDSKE